MIVLTEAQKQVLIQQLLSHQEQELLQQHLSTPRVRNVIFTSMTAPLRQKLDYARTLRSCFDVGPLPTPETPLNQKRRRKF